MADLCEKGGSDVSDFVVSDGGEATFGTGKGMLNSKLVTTCTVSREVGRGPPITEGHGIAKGTLV